MTCGRKHRRPPDTHWDRCCLCGDAKLSAEMVGVEEVLPHRVRGYVCDPAGPNPCTSVVSAMKARIRADLQRRLPELVEDPQPLFSTDG